ncbi:MAG: primosomal protein N' [Crocinitomicaceae bacterium]|nr:primosomal protein N' [Crocinitomicaceae bacterium]
MAERITYFVDVILPLSIPNAYTYRVPFELNNHVDPGKRVVVPFGKSKFYTGIIRKVHEEVPKNYQVKYIEGVLDENPIVTERQFKLWDWIADYYIAPIGDVMNAALPANFKLASETKISIHPEFDRDLENLTDNEITVVEALQLQESLTLKEISDLINIKTVQPLIKKLIEKKKAIVSEELNAKYSPRFQSFIEISEHIQTSEKLENLLNELEANKRNEKQVNALLKIVDKVKWNEGSQNPIPKKEILAEEIGESTLQTLEKKGIITIFNAEVSRLVSKLAESKEIKALSPSQQKGLEEIKSHFEEKDVVLLHGVTSSGKTEIYVSLIQEMLEQGKQVLFLIPEIALTTQLITRLQHYFGDLVGVYHSRFNQNERIEIWHEVLKNSGKFRIILGARSSVFLPFQNLGLVIIDEEHKEAFKNKEQVILFQNRRGYTPIWSCELCGWTPTCKNCDVSLTYHKLSNALKCHYCGYFITPPASCGGCGSRKLKMLGFGTEKVEDELAILFPNIKIQRMDLDTTRAKNSYQQIISSFENREVDVLIGTQMVTKGLDFDNVGLVGILSADQMLHYPDFRSFERSFQLMSQVAGRAGRKAKRGKVIIQSFNPDHWIIQKVMQHDYEGLYNQEILERKNFHYPPFFRIISLTLKHRDKDVLEMGSITLGKNLKAIFNERLLGPETPTISRIKNMFIKTITIKFERESSPKKVKDVIREKIEQFLAMHDYRAIRVDIDVDPQ